jgi:hypothetical protein
MTHILFEEFEKLGLIKKDKVNLNEISKLSNVEIFGVVPHFP